MAPFRQLHITSNRLSGSWLPWLCLLALAFACDPGTEASDAPPHPVQAQATTPSTRSAEPSRDELERLRALGYLDFTGDEDSDRERKIGVVHFDTERAHAGYNLYNEQFEAVAYLIDMRGNVVHRFQDPEGLSWSRVELLGSGDLVAVGAVDVGQKRGDILPRHRYLMRQTWDGTLRWKRRIAAHHDVEILPDGRMWTLSMHKSVIPAIDPVLETRDDYLTLIAADGQVLAEHSLYELLSSAPEKFAFQDVRSVDEALSKQREQRRESRRAGKDARAAKDFIDLLHSNSIEAFDQPSLSGQSDLYQEDSLLVTSRHQDTIAVIGASDQTLRWAWGRGELSGPHDASWLENGNILVFDNGLGRNWSRVIEVAPETGSIVWEYKASTPEQFYTVSRGSAQRLGNGNTLITNSGAGQVFEVTRDGEIVWEWWNPATNRFGRRATLGRMHRLDASFVEKLLARQAAGG